MNYNDFFGLIASGGISGAYLFHGEEEYIKQSALNMVRELIDISVRDMNVLDLSSPDFSAVRDACQTLPFLCEKRIVIAQNMADSEIKLVLPMLDEILTSTVLIIYQRGKAHSNILKPFCQVGEEVCFKTMNSADAVRFITKNAKKRNVSISQANAALLIEMVGLDAHSLLNEFIKASDYVGIDGEITKEVLLQCVTPHIEYEFFKIIDMLIKGKKDQALRAFRHLTRNDNSAAIPMTHYFTRQLNNILGAALLLKSGVREAELGAKLGITSWAASSAAVGAKKIPTDKLKQAAMELSTAEYKQISGQMPADRSIELAIMRYFYTDPQ